MSSEEQEDQGWQRIETTMGPANIGATGPDAVDIRGLKQGFMATIERGIDWNWTIHGPRLDGKTVPKKFADELLTMGVAWALFNPQAFAKWSEEDIEATLNVLRERLGELDAEIKEQIEDLGDAALESLAAAPQLVRVARKGASILRECRARIREFDNAVV